MMRRGSQLQTLSYPPARPTTRLYNVHAPHASKCAVVSSSASSAAGGQRGEGAALGRKFDVIPEARNYKFEDVFHGEFGDNALLDPHNSGLKEHDPLKEALFIKVDKLEQSKKQAASTFAALCAASESPSQGHTELIAAATQDQHAVLRDRIHVLNDLIQHPSSRICINHHMLQSTPRALVAVTYNRYVRASADSFKEVGEIQSPMAWLVPGAQTHVASILTGMASDTGEDHQLAKSLKGLLTGVTKCVPFQRETKKLRKSLRATYPTAWHDQTELGIPSTQGTRHAQPAGITSHHVRVLSAETEIVAYKDKKAEKVTAMIISGVLDLNVLELWQNPSTNTLVRKSIVQTALHHKPNGQLTNVHTLHIKLLRGQETHILTFRPFIGTEACTVTHMLYSETHGADDKNNNDGGEHGAQKGILHLPDDPTLVQPLPGGRILPLKSYVCLGAHRESRYNEAQLNYIHSRAYTQTVEDQEELQVDKKWGREQTPGFGLEPSMLPHADQIHWAKSRSPSAKATRISGKDCDVMVSSYEIGQEVHTAMTVISYPPFGTQFKVKKRKSKKLEPMIGPQQRPHAKKKAAAAAAAGSDAPLQTTTIPLPVNLQHTTKKAVREQQARIQKDIQAMQTHIHSLESKLARTRGGNGNSEHLMQEVLRRLQARV